MQKICYLHLGFHKTASTSFQATCAKNINLLEEHDITYPIFKCNHRPEGIVNHSIPIISMFCNEPENYHINKRWKIDKEINDVNASYKNQFEEYLASSKNLCISGEGISLLDPTSLRKMISTITNYDYKINTIALIRSPYSALCSEIQQKIKIGFPNSLISLNDSARKPNWLKELSKARLVEKLDSILRSSINYFSFETACQHLYGPAGFLIQNHLRTDPSKFMYFNENKSLYNLTVRLQNELNKVSPRFKGKTEEKCLTFPKGALNPEFIQLNKRIDQNFADSGIFLLTEAEHSIIEDHIISETEQLLKLTGINFKHENIKFSEAFMK